jgi:hypothetical protein
MMVQAGFYVDAGFFQPTAHFVKMRALPEDLVALPADFKVMKIPAGLWFQSMPDYFFGNRFKRTVALQTS